LENGNTASLNINLSSPAVFIGDGGGLSNISASAVAGNLQAVTDNGAATTNKITLTNGLTSLVTSGNVLVTGNVTASFFRGDGGTLSNIAANKNFQEVTDLGATSSNKITLTNSATSLQTSGNVVVTGNVTASKFYGDGTTLTGVALSTDLVSNSTRIGTVSTDLASNSTRIGTVSTDLASNSTRIGTVSTDLASNSTRIGTVSTDLVSNSTRIGTVSTDLVDNSTRISTVSTDLASNVLRIGTLESEVQPLDRGGTGQTSYSTGDILYGASSGTTLNKLSPAGSNADVGKFLKLGNSDVPEWATVSVSSTTISTTNVTIEDTDHFLIFVSDYGTGAQALKKEYGTLKYKPSTGTLTTSNVITSDTSIHARNGIANTTPTHTLSVGTVVSIQETASGDVIIVRGNGYFSDEVYIAKKLTIPVGGQILADKITVRSLETKGSIVFANRPPTSGIVLS
jgi:hypothetical protein